MSRDLTAYVEGAEGFIHPSLGLHEFYGATETLSDFSMFAQFFAKIEGQSAQSADVIDPLMASMTAASSAKAASVRASCQCSNRSTKPS